MTEYFNGEFFFNIALHVTFLFLFLSVFFIKYVKNIESVALNNEIDHIINNAFKNITNNDNIKQTINTIKDYNNTNSSYIFDYYKNIFNQDDQERNSVNTTIINSIVHIDVLLVFVLILFVIILIKTNSISLITIVHVIGENILTFILVGIVEYLFFTKIALNYVPSLPSNMYTSILANLQSNFSV
jgi:hypothetical protein